MSQTAIINVALRSAAAASEIMQDIALDLGVVITRLHSMAYDVEACEESYENVEDLICDLECALLEYDGINIEDIEVTDGECCK
jgi:hypothetical protein